VTSAEIIIRIKKARKKWKLIVPKKRIASYRTNRWFAKPRWVEIELTYTQASKLGLVEPRTPGKEVTRPMSAEHQVARHAIVESERALPGDSASEPEPDSTSTCQASLELDPNIDQPGQLIGADDVDFASDGDHLEDDTVLSGPLLPHGDSRVPLLQTLSTADTDVCSRQSTSPVATARPRADKAARRTSAFLLIASSASVLASVAIAWIMFSSSATTPMTADTACKRSEQLSSCSQTIVTGSISKVDQPQWPEPRSATTLATQASSEPVSAIEQPQLNVPQLPKAATAPTAREDDSGKVGNRVDNGDERPGQASAVAESDPLPAATTPKNSLPLSVDRHDCRELRAVGQSINIQFDYASSSLNQAILPTLEAFAVRLRSCPSAKVTIEGHTDSDGRAAWNQSLSVHRARTVLAHLVHAGAEPDQLSAIGFGQSHPSVPNVSTKNKRSNRRVALVVEIAR
jgi:outer membrane protein OmpA-like peptidoglycan-associated protein